MTSSTARYLCSVTLNSHSMSESVKHQAKPMCQASSGTAHVRRACLCENFLYGFKAARRAARAADSAPSAVAPADAPAPAGADAGRLARKAKSRAAEPGEVTEPRRI